VRLWLGWLVCLGTIASCTATPAPLGEALVVVQTDVTIPRRIGKLRIDVLDPTGATTATREVITPTAEDWPVSFSVVGPDDGSEKDFLLRLRAYPEGHEISARDLAAFASRPPHDTTVYASIDEACGHAPELKLGEPLTLRRGDKPITTVLRSNRPGGTPTCVLPTNAGSAVARVDITERGKYVFEVVSAVPDGAHGEYGGDTTLSLRTDCAYPTAQLGCSDDIDADNLLSRLEQDLEPGRYFVVTGGRVAAPADLTLRVTRSDVIGQAPTPQAPQPTGDLAALAPEPGVTIDRLVAVHVRPGERGDVVVTLNGECFGTTADVTARTTCVDVAGVRVPAPLEVPRAPFTHEIARAQPTWKGDVPVPCTSSPRPPSNLLDEEVCVPGGAFILGDTLGLVDLERRAQPERMRVVEPFLIDKYELSVARYRDALRHGFKSPDDTPRPNNRPKLEVDPTLSNGEGCSYNQADSSPDPFPGVDRERYPLTCISWAAARAFCKFLVGDLPTEDQWEYAATAAAETPGPERPYPWGTELPTCSRTVYSRTLRSGRDICAGEGLGPVPVDADVLKKGDVSLLGIVGLGGNVQELLATGFAPYADPAWERAGLRGAFEDTQAPLHSTRGADWSGFPVFAVGSARRAQPTAINLTSMGFRCARPGR
jgi:formylglycine-generating enzyme required for sulfatase activity